MPESNNSATPAQDDSKTRTAPKGVILGGDSSAVSDSSDAPNCYPVKPNGNTILSRGVANYSAISLAKPTYPPTAKAVGAAGAVNVHVTIDEKGYVTSAAAVSGHPLLRAQSVLAAYGSRFKPTLLLDIPVRSIGVIVYNFQ
jgi:outer membrane biosynthesis protein TonB